jgi:hypothetical protein
VPDHGHSAKRVYIALVCSSFSLTLSLTHPCRRRHKSPPRPRRARARPRRARPRPRPEALAAAAATALYAIRRALTVPPPCPPRVPSVLSLAVPSPCPRRVPAVRALVVPSPCPCRAPTASPRRLVRDPSSRPLGMIRFNIVLIRLIFSFLVLNLCTCMIRLILSIDDCRPSCR